jgi:leucyl-tRNA synthetase
MEGEYNHKEIEQKWQDFWSDNKTFKTESGVSGKENYYTLSEFPYPSGDLHVGHWYAFAVTDMFAKYKKLQGYNVLFPIGFDAFGLPAENAAIKRGLDPREWTASNMESMKKQLVSMGASFDWDRVVATCDPSYYKWTQWIFTQMFEKGLAYKKKGTVNWDPVDKTVLANEQVQADGTAERSGAKVEKKEIDQWYLKITDYAERLNDDLDNLDWPKQIKDQQKNWIGKSNGSEVSFEIKGSDEKIKVFTTRVDTIFGATYLVLAPEHGLAKTFAEDAENTTEILEYIEKAKEKDEIERTNATKEKTGVEIKGIKAINPANDTEIPVFVADYVLGGYGTAAIMAVPAHDDRDMEFAQKFDLKIIEVISEKGILINSGNFDGLTSEEAKEKITEHVGGEIKTIFKLRDWSVGRQRYWGCPMPIVYDPEGNPHAVSVEHLPWELPTDVDHTPTGEPPLAKSKDLQKRTTEIFGDGWTPEIETLDTFVDSSWYYLRYLDPKNTDEIAGKGELNNWMPVDYYTGGSEHTTLHLLYSRFFNKFLFDLGVVRESEPYTKRLNRGLILGTDGAKMSKSKGNVINPDEIVENLGSDTVRLYLAFIGPYNEAGSYPWDTNGVVGVRRFLEKVWRISERIISENKDSSPEIEIEISKLTKKTAEDFEDLKMNTTVSSMMSFINVADKNSVSIEDLKKFVIILSTMAPHIAEEIWSKISDSEESVFEQSWPEFNEELLDSQKITLGIQVNGKVRAEIELSPDESEENLKEKVINLPEIQKWTEGNEIRKFIYVPGKIINIVV